MAGAIKRRLGVPVVCTLSGEDIFLEGIPEPYYSQAREELARHAADVDHFVALNNYYAAFSADYLQVPRERIDVIPHGLILEGHGDRPAGNTAASDRVRTIGFLARICKEKGLHYLVEAFRLLLEDKDLPPLRLLAAGYLGAAERPYLESVQQTAADHGFADRFEYVGEPDRAGKIAFLQSLDVMGLPTVYRESKGLPVLEAMANGVPVVLPSHGAFPEMIDATGGGLLCEPDDPQSLADELRRLLSDDALSARCGQSGYDAVRQQFTADVMAQRTLALYNRLLDPAANPTAAKSVGAGE
jgi:glycosyltransferase involved in cell wall biosynthesis